MAEHILPSIILLTYKGKALLVNRKNSPIDEEKHPWSFIGGVKEKNESFENAMTRRVEKETGIKIQNIKQISVDILIIPGGFSGKKINTAII